MTLQKHKKVGIAKIICDGCDKILEVPCNKTEELVDVWKAYGWGSRRVAGFKEHFCPDCRD